MSILTINYLYYIEKMPNTTMLYRCRVPAPAGRQLLFLFLGFRALDRNNLFTGITAANPADLVRKLGIVTLRTINH